MSLLRQEVAARHNLSALIQAENFAARFRDHRMMPGRFPHNFHVRVLDTAGREIPDDLLRRVKKATAGLTNPRKPDKAVG